MKKINPPLHQPPNPADLLRVPPANVDCARIRGLMRDFADGDLTPAEQAEVECHAHTCHACGVELSRAEHEVARLRRAFRVGASPASAAGEAGRRLPEGFAARVVERLLQDETPDGAPSADAVGAPAPAVDSRRETRAILAAVAALLLVVAGIAALWLDGGDREPDRKARLVVTQATGAWGANGRRLASGEGLAESQSLTVAAGGGAEIDWHDVSPLSQPAATIKLDGSGELRLQSGAPVLLHGTMHVETHRPVTLTVEDGTAVQLGIGEYVIVADAAAGLAGDRYQPSMQDPLASAPADLRVEIQVLRGEAATIARTDVGPTLVAQGTVGVFQGGVVSTRPAVGPAITNDVVARGPAGTAPSPTQPMIAAFVHERSSVPSVGTAVALAYAAESLVRYGFGVTNANGAFVMNPDSACESDFLVMQAYPALTRLELGLRAPDAYKVLRNGAEVRSASSLVLDVSPPLTGVIVDESGQPRLGVRVLPCIVDELFGTLLPLVTRLAYSDQEGRFAIHQLPVTLPAHQGLVLVMAHPNLRPAVVPVPTRGSAAALLPLPEIVLRAPYNVRFHQLPPNAQITVLEEFQGVPAGSAAWQRVFTTDSAGYVWLAPVGSPELWLRIGSESNYYVQKFVLDQLGPIARYHPASQLYPIGEKFDPLAPLAGTDLLIASTYRHQHFLASASATAASSLAMVATDALGRSVADAQVFAVHPTGPRGRCRPMFLGFTSTNGVISLDPVSGGGDVVVVAADGSSGFVASPQQALVAVNTTVATPGRVLLQPSLRPSGNASQAVVPLTFRRADSVLPGVNPVAYRFASEATGWEVGDLPPGLYEVKIGTTDRVVVVPAGGFATLQ